MNNENNVNATQNPNETNVNPTVQPVGQPVPGAQPVAPAPQAASTQPAESVPVAAPVPGPINEEVKPAGDNNLQTIVVPSSFPDEAPAATASPVSMPAIVNPLEIKPEEVKPEVKPVAKPVENPENQPKKERVSEYQEKLKQAQENYKPPSKLKMFMNIFWIVLVIIFGMFLPEISSGINKVFGPKPEGPEPDPTTGTLVCTLESNTSNLDKGFSRKFSYEDNKLKSAVLETSTRGDITLDEATLNDLYSKCDMISKGVENVEGIQVTCEYTEGLLVERERFDYKSYDLTAITAAYTEAGSSVVEFDYDADIDEIMKSMRQAGFTCNKEKPKNSK